MAEFKIVNYEAPKPENEYRAHVEALFEATVADETAAGEFAVPADKIGPAKRLISEAARELGRTAKYVAEEDSKDGKVHTLTVILAPKRKTGPRGPRKPKDEDSTETAAE